MFPCTDMSSKKSFPSATWQKKAMIFDIPGLPKPERGHIHQSKTALLPPLQVLELCVNNCEKKTRCLANSSRFLAIFSRLLSDF